MLLSKEIKLNRLLLLCFFSAGILLSMIDLPIPFYQSEEIAYIMLIMAWVVMVRRRLVQHNSRSVLIIMGGFLILLFALRSLKYNYAYEIYGLGRYMWYCYYITLILVPVMSLHAALTIHRPEGIRKKKFVTTLYIICFILIVSVMTNEFHQLVFRFENSNMEDVENYKRAVLYYVIFIWIMGLQLGSIYVAFDKCRIPKIKKRIWIPISFMAAMYLFLPLVNNFGKYNPLKWLNFQECFTMMIIGLWEMFLDNGFIRTNNSYESFFAESSITSVITGEDFVPVFSSVVKKENIPVVTTEQMKNAREGIIYLDSNTRLHCHPISAGYVYWLDDISEISRLNMLLQDVNEQLAEEKNLIQQENDLKALQASYEIQNKIYDSIAEHLRPVFDRISRLLDNTGAENFEKRLAGVSVMGAYVKRYANLVLIAENNGYIDLKELYLSVRESMEYLNLCGITCTATEKLRGDFPAKYVIEMFEVYERVVEQMMWSGGSLMVNLALRQSERQDEGKAAVKTLEMRVMLECDGIDDWWTSSLSKALKRPETELLGGRLSVTSEDECCHISLLFAEGGAGNDFI